VVAVSRVHVDDRGCRWRDVHDARLRGLVDDLRRRCRCTDIHHLRLGGLVDDLRLRCLLVDHLRLLLVDRLRGGLLVDRLRGGLLVDHLRLRCGGRSLHVDHLWGGCGRGCHDHLWRLVWQV